MKLLILAILAAVITLVALRVRAAQGLSPEASPTASAKAPPALSMEQAEESIRKLIRGLGTNPVGEVRAGLDDGVTSYGGTVEVGNPRRKVDIGSMETPTASPSFSDLLTDLRSASRRHPQGPAYLVFITAHAGGEIGFEYFFEGVPLKSIKDLRLGQYEFVPAAVYRQRFDAAMLAELNDFEVNAAIAAHVPARLEAGKSVSPELTELMATIDWEGDVNNGGMDQYFARRHSDYTGQDRASLYPLVQAGLERVGAHEAASLFVESIALWAHFHPEVESARTAMQIAAVPRQEQSDIGNRYYRFQPELDKLRAAYVRAHPEILEKL